MSRMITKRIKQEDVYKFNIYPIINGQTFFTERGVFYEDIGGKRCAIINVKSTQGLGNLKEFRGEVIVNTYDSKYSIYYIDEEEEPTAHLIASSDSNVIPTTLNLIAIINEHDKNKSVKSGIFFKNDTESSYDIEIKGNTKIENAFIDGGE